LAAAVFLLDERMILPRQSAGLMLVGSLGCMIQNGFRCNYPIRSCRGCLTSFGNSSVLSFYPMPTVEKASRRRAGLSTSSRQRAFTLIPSGCERGT
jgi:hypothetical protein